jgi:hypothetical protein
MTLNGRHCQMNETLNRKTHMPSNNSMYKKKNPLRLRQPWLPTTVTTPSNPATENICRGRWQTQQASSVDCTHGHSNWTPDFCAANVDDFSTVRAHHGECLLPCCSRVTGRRTHDSACTHMWWDDRSAIRLWCHGGDRTDSPISGGDPWRLDGKKIDDALP